MDRLSAVSYKEASIKKEIGYLCPDIDMEQEIKENFKAGSFYPLPQIKSTLQDIYDKYGYEKTAKGTDIVQWLENRVRRAKKPNNEGKRVEGYDIL